MRFYGGGTHEKISLKGRAGEKNEGKGASDEKSRLERGKRCLQI